MKIKREGKALILSLKYINLEAKKEGMLKRLILEQYLVI